VGKEVFQELLVNARIAKDERIPICQDTGLAITFPEVGQRRTLSAGVWTMQCRKVCEGRIRRAT
jgi:fumarate hydratase subunit alpha